ncbi:hypothetical protein CALCODRAFT_479083 [Calocera cornea HHB12733]|uniref:Uncharacterized protein n=1 Tax=Calocera cornea HHB12733 TaxID=1353952 RepID=A0A165JZZ7_9BASI|nr:hypothetical protein CALCODRAFT_479083 [Calocera cornea HHB12733]
MREGMIWREWSGWVDEAKNRRRGQLGWKPPIHKTHLKVEHRHDPATAPELAYEREIAAHAGLEAAYDAKAVPSAPSTEGQRRRLRELGAQRLQDLQALARSREKKSSGIAASVDKGVAKDVVERELSEASVEEVADARSEKDRGTLATAKKENAKEVVERELSEPSVEGVADARSEKDRGTVAIAMKENAKEVVVDRELREARIRSKLMEELHRPGSEVEQDWTRGYTKRASVPSAPQKPNIRSIELAQGLMEHGAPKIDGVIPMLSKQEINAWLSKIKQETDIDFLPTEDQLTLAQHMVEQGARNADKLREGMTWRELTAWMDEAKNLGWKPPALARHIGPKQRSEPATAAQLAYAHDLAAYAKLEVPYVAEDAKRGEVEDFIAQARATLTRKGATLRGQDVPSGPASKLQKVRLRRLGEKLSPGLTWGEAHKRLQELQEAKKSRKNKSSGSVASAKKENGNENVEPELAEKSAEMKLPEAVDRTRSEEENAEKGTASAEGAAAERKIGQGSDEGRSVRKKVAGRGSRLLRDIIRELRTD